LRSKASFIWSEEVVRQWESELEVIKQFVGEFLMMLCGHFVALLSFPSLTTLLFAIQKCFGFQYPF